MELAIASFLYDPAQVQVLETIAESSGLREPSCPIPRAASRISGIARRSVRGPGLDYRRIRALARQADFIVAHYAQFDRGFVERLMTSFRRATWLCSRDGIDWWAKGFESRALDELVAARGIENPSPHRAGGDAALLALLSCRPKHHKPYSCELLRKAGLIKTRRSGKLVRSRVAAKTAAAVISSRAIPGDHV